MKTAGELAKELNTDPRNIVSHIETASKLGVSLAAWIDYLQELPTVEEVARELGVSPSTVRRRLKKWLEERNLKTEYYEYYERRKVKRSGKVFEVTVRTLRVPRMFLLEEVARRGNCGY